MNTQLRGTDEVMLPAGFRAAGVRAGIKRRDVKDMGLIVSDVPATVAGVFTTNQVSAAPVKLCRNRLKGGTARAVIANSGNATACTGAGGMADAERMAHVTAETLAIPEGEVFVCSTGHIGGRLPMDVVEPGIRNAADHLSDSGGKAFAEAIMTTDIRAKYWTVKMTLDGKPVTLSGVAKGAGMIEPNMATMLAFIMTDAAVEREALQEALSAAVDQSFNRITVDGDQSTNDTVLLMANGRAGNATLDRRHSAWPDFFAALNEVALQLALKIVDDGEGANKRIAIVVEGAANDADADQAARAVANSFLVKTSWAGVYPNWGRIMDALGYSKARVDEDQVDIWYDTHHATHNGVATDTPLATLKAVIEQEAFTIRINLNLGEGRAVVYTCEITEEYVRINVT